MNNWSKEIIAAHLIFHVTHSSYTPKWLTIARFFSRNFRESRFPCGTRLWMRWWNYRRCGCDTQPLTRMRITLTFYKSKLNKFNLSTYRKVCTIFNFHNIKKLVIFFQKCIYVYCKDDIYKAQTNSFVFSAFIIFNIYAPVSDMKVFAFRVVDSSWSFIITCPVLENK